MTFKMEERTLVEEIRTLVPSGATHYEGLILINPFFYKIVELTECSPIEKLIFFWNSSENSWKYFDTKKYIFPKLREIKFASEKN